MLLVTCIDVQCITRPRRFVQLQQRSLRMSCFAPCSPQHIHGHGCGVDFVAHGVQYSPLEGVSRPWPFRRLALLCHSIGGVQCRDSWRRLFLVACTGIRRSTRRHSRSHNLSGHLVKELVYIHSHHGSSIRRRQTDDLRSGTKAAHEPQAKLKLGLKRGSGYPRTAKLAE